MNGLIEAALRAIHAHQHLAYVVVGLLAFSESLPVIGSLIPGTTIIIAIAALVPSGAIHFWPLLGAAILGAIGGDGFSYWLGRRYHREITGMWPLSRYPRIIELGDAAFAKHGGKSIFIARFTPAIRAIVPMVAGILRMDPWRFYLVNIVSAIAWAPAHIVPGVVAGASLVLAGAVAGRLLVLVVVLLILLWLVFLATRYALQRGLPWAIRAISRAWLWASQRDTWLSREVLSLVDPRHREAKGLAALGLLLVLSLWAFLTVLKAVTSGSQLILVDTAVFNFLQGLRTSWGDQLMVGLTELGDGVVTLTVVVVGTAWLLGQRAWRAALYWIGAGCFATAGVEVLKQIVGLPRPVSQFADGSAFAFPSGHTAVNVTIYGFLALLAGRELGPRARNALTVAIGVLVCLIAFSRLYLGTHWALGVIAGFAFGIAWIGTLGIAYLTHDPHRIAAPRMLGLTAAALVLAGGVHIAAAHHADLQRYVAAPKIVREAAAAWWRDGWRRLPARRIDLAGGLEEPLTFQWAGSLEALRSRLVASGWQEPPPWDLESALTWVETGIDPSTLPVLNRLHNGRPARLILIHHEPDHPGYRARLILRAWLENVVLEQDGREYPVWVGAVVEQRLYRVASLMTLGIGQRNVDTPLPILISSLGPDRLVFRQTRPSRFGWNGWVILAHEPALELPHLESESEP